MCKPPLDPAGMIVNVPFAKLPNDYVCAPTVPASEETANWEEELQHWRTEALLTGAIAV